MLAVPSVVSPRKKTNKQVWALRQPGRRGSAPRSPSGSTSPTPRPSPLPPSPVQSPAGPPLGRTGSPRGAPVRGRSDRLAAANGSRAGGRPPARHGLTSMCGLAWAAQRPGGEVDRSCRGEMPSAPETRKCGKGGRGQGSPPPPKQNGGLVWGIAAEPCPRGVGLGGSHPQKNGWFPGCSRCLVDPPPWGSSSEAQNRGWPGKAVFWLTPSPSRAKKKGKLRVCAVSR